MRASTTGFNTTRSRNHGLLPQYFKKVGFALMAAAIIPALIIKLFSLSPLPVQKDVFRLMTLNGFIVGLLFIAVSKDRIEDELTMRLRLKSMSIAFTWAVIYVVLHPLVTMVFNEPVADANGQQLVITMLLAYLLLYYAQKAGR